MSLRNIPIIVGGIIWASPALAQVFKNPIAKDDLLGVVCAIRNGLFPLLMAFAVIAFIVSAYFYITSNGDAAKVTRAKQALLGGIIGVVIALMAFGLPTIIFELFGANVAMAC